MTTHIVKFVQYQSEQYLSQKIIITIGRKKNPIYSDNQIKQIEIQLQR